MPARRPWFSAIILIALLVIAPAHAQFGGFHPFQPVPVPLTDPRLFDAVADNDLPRVRQLLQSAPGLLNVGVNKGWETASETRTPLQEALIGRTPRTSFSDPSALPPTAAAISARKAIIALLLDRGAKIGPDHESRYLNSPFYSPITPLQFAVVHSTPDIAALLLSRGGDPSLPEHTGFSAFHMAVWRGDVPMIRLLLAHGAKPDAPTGDGQTPLELTLVGKGCLNTSDAGLSVAEALLQGGADPNRRDARGQTPLLAAMMGGHRQTAQALIAHRANLLAPNRRGDTPFSVALASDGMADLLPMILARGPDVNAADGEGMTPLGRAMRHISDAAGPPAGQVGQPEEQARWLGIARQLLDRGAKPDATDEDGLTPLRYALLHGDPMGVQFLLWHGAKPDTFTRLLAMTAQNDAAGLTQMQAANASLTEARAQSGETLLHLAALWGAADSTRFLLSHGADPNAYDSLGKTPLENACRAPGQEAVAALLLQAGADPNRRSSLRPYETGPSFEFTALQIAVQARDDETVRLLLAAHADPNESVNGKTPLQILLSGLQHFSVPSTATEDAEIMRLAATLLQAGADPNPPERLLPPAIDARNAPLLKLLFEHGAYLPKDGHGPEYQPLLLDAATTTPEIVQLLLDHGADVNALSRSAADNDNFNHETALQKASANDHLDIVQLLLSKGADANGGSRRGLSPLLTASGPNQAAIMEALLAHGADINAKDSQGQTAFMRAALWNEPEIASLLIAKGADPNTVIYQGRTILIVAISQVVPGREAVSRSLSSPKSLPPLDFFALLLAHGADVNARGDDGKTALTWARASQVPGRDDLIALLLKAGAKE